MSFKYLGSSLQYFLGKKNIFPPYAVKGFPSQYMKFVEK